MSTPLTDEEFHTLRPRKLFGFAVDGAWSVEAAGASTVDGTWSVEVATTVEIGEFVEILSNFNGSSVMAQGRVTSVSRTDRFRLILTLEQVTSLMLLEYSCQEG